MRIGWFSNPPWVKGGYGVQTRLFVPRIRALGHEVACIADVVLYHGVVQYDGYDVFPAPLNRYGDEDLHFLVGNLKLDCLIHHGCIWGVTDSMMALPWVPWFPVDRDPFAPAVALKASASRYPICFSEQGRDSLVNKEIPCDHVPLAVDMKVYDIRDKAECRDFLGLPRDKFIALIVADNKGFPSRKAIPQQVEAFVQFNREHPDTMLVCHMTPANDRGGLHLQPMLDYLKVDSKTVMFPDRRALRVGFEDEYMVKLYNAADVLLNVSMDEGFGAPIVEAQACGTPVITGDWTAMTEVTKTGHLIQKDEAERWWNPLGGYQYLPHIEAIAQKLVYSYRDKHIFDQDMRENCRGAVLHYDVDHVLEHHWKRVLTGLEQCFANGRKGRIALSSSAPQEPRPAPELAEASV